MQRADGTLLFYMRRGAPFGSPVQGELSLGD